MFEQKQLRLSATCAQYLYGGIIADTLRFSIATIKPRTLRTAAYLLEMGVDVKKPTRIISPPPIGSIALKTISAAMFPCWRDMLPI